MSEAYRQSFAAIYDRLMEDMPYEEWQRFVRDAWQRYGVEPHVVVDLACGTGKHSIALAQEGLHAIGIDLSESMLTIAQTEGEHYSPAIQAAGGSLTWLQQDMREWDIGRRADAVLCLCDGINYLLEDEDIQHTFAQVYNGLDDGGLFVFDVLTEHQYVAYAEGQPYTYDDEDLAYIWYSDWDAEARIMTHELTIFIEEAAASNRFARVHETHIQRAYTLSQLSSWLREAGFSRIDSFADFTWEPSGEHTGRLFICAKK